jgi:hypothetical protein
MVLEPVFRSEGSFDAEGTAGGLDGHRASGDVTGSYGLVQVIETGEFGCVLVVPVLDLALAVGKFPVLDGERAEFGGELFDVGGGAAFEPFDVETVAAVDASAHGSEFDEPLLGVVLPPVGVLERVPF